MKISVKILISIFHRFYTKTSDSCLGQFKRGYNAESVDKLPNELQIWLSMIADINDADLKESIDTYSELNAIRKEVSNMSQDKEVQAMLLEEKFAMSDWITAQSSAKKLGEENGRLELIIELITDGTITVEEGAKKADMTTTELREKAALLGKQI